MYDVNNFSIKDMTECAATLRKIGVGAKTMEEAATRIVRFFYENFSDSTIDGKAYALVRLFKTHLYSELHQDLQGFADKIMAGQSNPPGLKCLTLLGTAGDQEAWNSRRASQGHQAIPLPSQEFINNAPMIARLMQQLGLELEMLLGKPESPLLLDLHEKTFNVFHVPYAGGSSYIPAQETFVAPCKIRSVLGCGGILPSVNLFALIIFSKSFIPQETAAMFKTLALSIKVTLLPFEQAVFVAS